MNRFKKKVNKFTQISNQVLLDDKLSLKAKGLYSIIQHYITIPDFVLYKNTLLKACKESKNTFDNIWKELKDAGYLLQEKKVDSKTGRFFYEYDLLDEPIPQKTIPGKTSTWENGLYINTDVNNTDLNNTENNIHTSLGNDASGFYNDLKELDDHIRKYTYESRYILPIEIFYSYMKQEMNVKHGILYKRSIEKMFNTLDAIYTEEYMEDWNIQECMQEYLPLYFAEHRRYYSMQEFFQKENFRIWFERTK